MTRSTEFVPSGVISLTTDFGHKGPFIGTMKGQILSRFHDAKIVDITHECSVHWPDEAGFWISRSYRYFPTGTVHLAVVDPGVGTGRDIIGLVLEGHVFLAPDNGLLTPLVESAPDCRVFSLDAAAHKRFGITTVSATFHGRDIFAPLAAEIAAGRHRPDDLGPPAVDLVPSLLEEPLVTGGRIKGVIVTVDNFGNLISNIDQSLVATFGHPRVTAAGHRIAFAKTYGAVQPGEYLALINSFGVLEIARAEQSASSGLGLERGAPVLVEDADPSRPGP
ncbi:MAG: SAM hydrolase/SAM-dependent halogenase family protein [Gammaproteobacteria bacterium]